MDDYLKYDGPALIIEIEGHRPYYLRPKSSLTIGRTAKNDIVLRDVTVSREHAIIRWDDKFPLIVDQGSTAGLIVDGDYSTFRHLYGLHRIKIGASYLRVDFVRSEVECPTEVEVLNFKAKNAILSDLDESDDVTLFGESGSEDIIGYLADNKSIQKLLINLEMSRRTGELSITESSVTGKLIFGLGKIRGARCGNGSDLQALQHICSFGQGSYHFTVKVDVGEYSLKLSPICYLRDFNKRITKRRPRIQQDDAPLINSHDAE